MARDHEWYLVERDRYNRLAMEKAFPEDGGDGWDPSKGWRTNRSRVMALYGYYRDLFNSDPDTYLWAGLARLAGGAVLSGLDAIPEDNDLLVETFLEAGRDIFLDLAWQHEVALQGSVEDLLELARFHEVAIGARKSYSDAWAKVFSGDPGEIAIGNEELLENEQFTVAQPRSDTLLKNLSGPSAWLYRQASAMTLAIHPYHRDFIIDFPNGDVRDADERWAWITIEGGMWQKWVEMPSEERSRLVNLDFETEIARGSFGRAIPELRPSPDNTRQGHLSSRRMRLGEEIVRIYKSARVAAGRS